MITIKKVVESYDILRYRQVLLLMCAIYLKTFS